MYEYVINEELTFLINYVQKVLYHWQLYTLLENLTDDTILLGAT